MSFAKPSQRCRSFSSQIRCDDKTTTNRRRWKNIVRPIAMGIAAATTMWASGFNQADAGRFDCGSDIVPIVHIESVGPVRYDDDAQSLSQHDDAALGNVSPLRVDEYCGWVEQATDPVAGDPTPDHAFEHRLDKKDAASQSKNSAETSSTAAMLAGLAAGGHWMHFAQPIQTMTGSWTAIDAEHLWDTASSTLEHLSETHLAVQTFREANSSTTRVDAERTAKRSVQERRREIAATLVGGSAMVATLFEEYQPYDLAASDRDPRESIAGPSDLDLPVWSSLAADYRPFCVHADDHFPMAESIDLVPAPVADPVPNGDVVDSIARRDSVEQVELQLALVLDEASYKMAAQQRADDALAATVDWVKDHFARWSESSTASIAQRLLGSSKLSR